jgi:hypothetical protein
MRALSCATGCLLSLANLDAGRINPEVRYGLSDGCEVVETCIRNVIDDEAGCVRNSGLIRISSCPCNVLACSFSAAVPLVASSQA